MIKNIEISVIKENKKLFFTRNAIITLDDKSNNVKELINKIKPHVTKELERFQIVSEVLYFGSQKMKEDESIPGENGIELEITIK